MKVTFKVTCSACGHRSRKYVLNSILPERPADEIVKAGWNSVGTAFYCPKCVKTWEERNGGRPLWGKEHTRERVYQVMVSDILDAVSYMEKDDFDI